MNLPALQRQPHILPGVHEPAFAIEVVEPTRELNRYEIEVTYPLRQLASGLGIQLGPGIDPLTAINAKYRELGVKAQWLADTTGGGNQPNHVSGGVFEKGGSGKIILSERTAQDFLDTKGVRNLE